MSGFDNAFGDLISTFGTAGMILLYLGIVTFAGYLFREIGRAMQNRGEVFDEMPLFIASIFAVLTIAIFSLIWSAAFGGRVTLRWILIIVGSIALGAWLFRIVGQKLTGNAPKFRDMSFGEAFGFVFGAALLIWAVYYYLQPKVLDTGVPNAGVVFFRWAVQGFFIAAAAAFVFRLLGRTLGTEGSKKLFRSMPLTASFGVLVILIYAFVAVFAGAIAPYGQAEILGAANVMAGGDPALGGNPDYPLGTDQIGRDILSRLIYGAQNTVGIAFVTTCLAFFIGGSLGFLASTLQGWLDQLLSRGVDVLMAIPSLIFALLLMTIAQVWAPILNIPLTIFMVLIIAVIDSTRVFRLARAVGLNIVVMDYIEAAKLRGEGLGYLVFKEILPNALAPLLAEFGLRFCFVFLTIAALSFLGVGIQPPLADWGTMVRDLGSFLNSASIVTQDYAANLPTEVLLGEMYKSLFPFFPAGAIALLTIAVNFVVDWMLHKTSGLKE